jgi:hypothetical protein
MHARRAIPALLVAAAFVVVAAPTFAQETNEYVAAAYPDSPIVVTDSNSMDDAVINAKVVDVLRNDTSLAGRIGVQTSDREVELTGIVTGPSMYRQAERDAKSVYGVRNVRNLMSTRMGRY